MNIIFPFSIFDCAWLAPVALIMDLLLGDPRLPWPHPVCLLGKFLDKLEKMARPWALAAKTIQGRARRARLAGLLCLAGALLLVYILCRFLLAIPGVNYLLAIYLAWAGLAMGCLLRTGKLVLHHVECGSLAQAREACGWLVSRTVNDMDRPMLRKTLADTLSENFTDAFTAPWFWLIFTGPIGLWFYKTVSTMDSQWGYLTEKWRDLGWAGAKGDDLLAWLPARLSIFMLQGTDFLCRVCGYKQAWNGHWPGFKQIKKQAGGMLSPNSGWSMAACAWLCNARMAGSSVYFGSNVFKAWLGPSAPMAAPWDKQRLLALCSLMSYSCLIGGNLFWFFIWMASLVF